MKQFATFVMLIAGLALFVPVAVGADDPVKARRALMKGVVGKNAKLALQMVKGETPFDAAKAGAVMAAISDVPDRYVKLFPEGSDMDPETEASPKIWQDMTGFLAAAEKLKIDSAAASTAAAQGEAQFATAFNKVVENCKACHEAYRIKKEEN